MPRRNSNTRIHRGSHNRYQLWGRDREPEELSLPAVARQLVLAGKCSPAILDSPLRNPVRATTTRGDQSA